MGGIGLMEILVIFFICGLVLVPIVGIGILVYLLIRQRSDKDSPDRPASKDR